MSKKWEEMTLDEKVEDLRRDIKAIFEHLNASRQAESSLSFRLDGAVSLLTEVSEAVKKLEKRT